IERRRIQDRRDDQEVDEHAEAGDANDRDQAGQRQRHAILGVEEIDRVHAAHHDIGVTDPHHVDDAEDQVQSERQQRKHAAEQDAVDDRLDKINVHALQPHIGFADEAVALQLGGGAGKPDGSDLQQIGAVDHLEHLLDVLLDNQYGKALGAD